MPQTTDFIDLPEIGLLGLANVLSTGRHRARVNSNGFSARTTSFLIQWTANCDLAIEQG